MLVSKEGKYTFYTDGLSKVIAVSTYAGKVVRGVAKCDPKDKFDIEKGKELAEARCQEKIAQKRAARARKEYDKALAAYEAAAARVNKMNEYVIDSKKAATQANVHLLSLQKSL